MNEQQLRQKVADTINAWVGSTRGSAGHREILQIYNGHTPLARGYRVQLGDAYCATTASAAYIAVGMADFTGTECGVDPWIKIAQGLGNGVFAPDKDISRQELVTMLYRYYHDYEKKALAAESKSVSFKDSGDIAGWAAAAVKVMTDAGVLRGYDNGDGTHSFRPQNTATRAEAAQIISGLSKLTP